MDKIIHQSCSPLLLPHDLVQPAPHINQPTNQFPGVHAQFLPLPLYQRVRRVRKLALQRRKLRL
ncbi:hypothetical protein MD484_g7182, partial [Candolleomyces efflorescens]